MFPINLSEPCRIWAVQVPLHSTMFPINPIFISNPNKTIILYIPLCFLLIKKAIKHATLPYQLYIPLCFLLIGLDRENVVNNILTLHSTMFPINPYTNYSDWAGNNLYIPLCFLLIDSGLLIKIWFKLLYIPLCFLLIKNIDRRTMIIDLFTFHYVSY